MKTPIQSLLLVALLLVVLYSSFYKPAHPTQKLNEQIDSLHHTLHRYNQALMQYDSAYQQLAHTRQSLVRLEELYNQQITIKRAELVNILDQLHELSQHRQNTQPVIVHSMDSLLFAP